MTMGPPPPPPVRVMTTCKSTEYPLGLRNRTHSLCLIVIDCGVIVLSRLIRRMWHGFDNERFFVAFFLPAFLVAMICCLLYEVSTTVSAWSQNLGRTE